MYTVYCTPTDGVWRLVFGSGPRPGRLVRLCIGAWLEFFERRSVGGVAGLSDASGNKYWGTREDYLNNMNMT